MLSVLLTITGFKALFSEIKVGSTTFENREDIMGDTKINWTKVTGSMFISNSKDFSKDVPSFS